MFVWCRSSSAPIARCHFAHDVHSPSLLRFLLTSWFLCFITLASFPPTYQASESESPPFKHRCIPSASRPNRTPGSSWNRQGAACSFIWQPFLLRLRWTVSPGEKLIGSRVATSKRANLRATGRAGGYRRSLRRSPALYSSIPSNQPSPLQPRAPFVVLLGPEDSNLSLILPSVAKGLGVPFLSLLDKQDSDLHEGLESLGAQQVEDPAGEGLLVALPTSLLEMGRVRMVLADLRSSKVPIVGCAQAGYVANPAEKAVLTHEFVMLQTSDMWLSQAMEELQGFIHRLFRPPSPLLLGSTVVSISPSQIEEHGAGLLDLCLGSQAVELCVDQVEGPNATVLRRCYALLRRNSALPIVWTLRSVSQGGKFTGVEDQAVSILRQGIRLGAEFVDVESIWDADTQEQLMKEKGLSRIITSFHDTDDRFYSAGEIAMTFSLMANAFDGLNDLALLAVTAESEKQQSQEMEEGLRTHWARRTIPASGFCWGKGYRESMARNPLMCFTRLDEPVNTREAAKAIESEGRLTNADLHAERISQGILPTKTFLHAGCRVNESVVPCLMRAGFRAAGVSDLYNIERVEINSFEDLVQASRGVDVGGVMLDDTLKEAVARNLMTVSPAAEAIGAVSALSCHRSIDGRRVLNGENKDWVGLYKILTEAVSAKTKNIKKNVLIIGSSAMTRAATYALMWLPRGSIQTPLLVHDPSNSGHYDRYLECTAIEDLEKVGELQRDIDLIISDLRNEDLMQIWRVLRETTVVVECAYHPSGTALECKALELGCKVFGAARVRAETSTAQIAAWSQSLPGYIRRPVAEAFVLADFARRSGKETPLETHPGAPLNDLDLNGPFDLREQFDLDNP